MTHQARPRASAAATSNAAALLVSGIALVGLSLVLSTVFLSPDATGTVSRDWVLIACVCGVLLLGALGLFVASIRQSLAVRRRRIADAQHPTERRR